MSEASHPDRCPLCGGGNECALARGAGGSCWCFAVTLRPEVRELVPPELLGVACVCRACATGPRAPARALAQAAALLKQRG